MLLASQTDGFILVFKKILFCLKLSVHRFQFCLVVNADNQPVQQNSLKEKKQLRYVILTQMSLLDLQ